jgi:drug/metabolite transporter (DMT)-like permease
VSDPVNAILDAAVKAIQDHYHGFLLARTSQELGSNVLDSLSDNVRITATVAVKYGGVAGGTVLSGTAPLFSIPLELLLFGVPPARQRILGALITVLGVGLLRA